MSNVLTPAALATYLLELLKEFWRKYVAKDPFYEFPPKAIAVLLVVLNYVAVLVLALLGLEGYELPTDWASSLRILLVAVLSALVSSALYVVGLRPFRIYAREYKALQEKVKEYNFYKGSKKSKK